jgi:hypothetical protein
MIYLSRCLLLKNYKIYQILNRRIIQKYPKSIQKNTQKSIQKSIQKNTQKNTQKSIQKQTNKLSTLTITLLQHPIITTLSLYTIFSSINYVTKKEIGIIEHFGQLQVKHPGFHLKVPIIQKMFFITPINNIKFTVYIKSSYIKININLQYTITDLSKAYFYIIKDNQLNLKKYIQEKITHFSPALICEFIKKLNIGITIINLEVEVQELNKITFPLNKIIDILFK